MRTKKTGKLDMIRRVAYLVDLLGLQPAKVAVANAAEEFGVTVHQVQNYYLPRAREAITADIGKSRKELVEQHDHRLNAIYHTSPKDRLAALAQLAALHGLNAPTQVAVTVGVLYNPEEQLKALSNPALLEKVLLLDAEFEKVRSENANGDGESQALPAGHDTDAGETGLSDDPRLYVPAPPAASPEGTAGSSDAS